MKNRKNLGCRIKGTKERGAWAELYFMVMAMSQGLRVSSPYGGLGPYDVGVEDGTGPILRVQVKCTLYQCCAGSYCMSINVKDGSTGRRRGYAPGTVDFFAIYIIPTDDWYILPYAVVGDRDANVYFRPGFKGQKYGEYREAWDLLPEAAKGRGKKRLEIRACCERAEGVEGIPMDVLCVKPVRAIRNVPQIVPGGGRGVPQRLKPQLILWSFTARLDAAPFQSSRETALSKANPEIAFSKQP